MPPQLPLGRLQPLCILDLKRTQRCIVPVVTSGQRMTSDRHTVSALYSSDRRISRALAALVVLIILAGFAKNFYLRAWLGTRPLILTAWVHGFVMTAWLVLFTAQVAMVYLRRMDLHRKFGSWGAWLAAVAVGVGIVTILVRARLMYPAATPLTEATVFVAFDGLSLLLYGALVWLGWQYRPQPAIHRRLMTMAVVALCPPAFGRLVAYVRADHIQITVLGLMTLTTLIFVTVDAVRSQRLQPASWAPGVLIVLINVATYFAQASI
jgi:hypothetical protein